MSLHEGVERRSVLGMIAGTALLASVGGADSGGDMGTSIDAACAAYLDAWARKDLDGISASVHPSVHFKGPMQELKGRDELLAAASRIFLLLERFEVRAQFVSGERAMFAYDFVCREPIGVCRTAELVRFEDGLIRDVELFFDARPFEALQRAQAQGRTTT